jgi:molecular chaperone GrpE
MSENAGTDPKSDADAAGEPVEDASEESAEAGREGAVDGEHTDSDLVARIAAHDEELATEVSELEARLDDAESEAAEHRERAEELESTIARTRADFENYKKRAKKRQEQIKETATKDLVGRLTEVRNNLLRALEQDEDADIRPGVESTLETFDRVLDEEDVTPIEPDLGSEVDPQRHEVMMRVESDQPEDTIASVFRPGYEMADSVIEEAQVTVSDGTGAGNAESGDGNENANDDGVDTAK